MRSTRGPVTVADVAARAGVHPSTVSRALNLGTDRVSPDLVRKVRAAAEELGYRPNGLARALRTAKSASVGMLIPDISNPVYAPVVRGVEDALRAEGLSVLVSSTDNDADREAALLDIMLDRKVDGLLLATATRSYQQAGRLLNARIPVTLIGRATDVSWAPIVRVDDASGIRAAVTCLAALGHRHIVHLAGTDAVSTGRDRRVAFEQAIAECGLRPEDCTVVSADRFGEPVGIDLGVLMARDLVSRNVTFTAVVAANDLLAIGCYQVFEEAGIRIPEAVSVVGYNDIFLADRISPPLTTVRVPFHEIGLHAGRLLLAQMVGAMARPPRR